MMAFNGGANYFPIGRCPACPSLDGPMDKCYSRWQDYTNGEAGALLRASLSRIVTWLV